MYFLYLGPFFADIVQDTFCKKYRTMQNMQYYLNFVGYIVFTISNQIHLFHVHNSSRIAVS